VNSAFVLARRPPVELPPAAQPCARVVAGVGGCGCTSLDLAAQVMGELGMEHAAAMHAAPDRDWTPSDWRTHIDEEHRILFPALLTVGGSDPGVATIVSWLEVDHGVYLDRLARGLDLPHGDAPNSIDVHSRIEDQLVRRYAAELRALTGKSAGVGMLMVSKDYAATMPAAAPAHAASSWWPWLVGSALGAGAWAVGLGPLGIALSAVGGAGGTYAAQKIAAPPHKSDGLLYVPPATFGDPESYFRQIAEQGAEVHAMLAARQDESDERVKKWKAAAKNIPLIGDYAGYLIDLGAWLGKALGSAYAEQNSPEDLQHAADGVGRWLQVGLVPPKPLFTAKDGAKFYGADLDAGIELLREGSDKSAADNLSARALKTMATLTILHAGCLEMRRAIADASSGNGSLRTAGWYGGKLVGFESIVAGVAACEFGADYDKAFAHAMSGTTRPIRAGLETNRYANAFTETMRAASAGELA
jgi:hypothetical protein